jgi:hypothetical protein
MGSSTLSKRDYLDRTTLRAFAYTPHVEAQSVYYNDYNECCVRFPSKMHKQGFEIHENSAESTPPGRGSNYKSTQRTTNGMSEGSQTKVPLEPQVSVTQPWAAAIRSKR